LTVSGLTRSFTAISRREGSASPLLSAPVATARFLTGEVIPAARLIRSVPSHIWKAGLVILRSFTLYRPLQVWGTLGLLFALAGAGPFVRFLYFYAQGQGDGHVQSLLAGSALLFMGVQMYIVGLLASAVGWNRHLLEEVLYRLKDSEGRLREGNHVREAANGRIAEYPRRRVHAA